MNQLLFATALFVPPAAMLLVAQTVRLGVGRWVAYSGVGTVLSACLYASWSAVVYDHSSFGEAESSGTILFALIACVVWLVGATFSFMKVGHR